MALATALCAWLPGNSYAQDRLPEGALGEVQRLSLLSTENSHPTVAYSADGSQLFAAWDGVVNGSRRILLRERVSGVWLPAVIVDTNPAGSNSLPSITVDGAGTPHLAWITTNADGQRAPVYARRISRDRNEWYQQAIPFPADSTAVSNCDYVNLQLDDLDRPWLAWQHGYGNVYNIACSRFNDEGEIVSDELTPGATVHNLYPEIFFLPEPTVYWYMWETDQFYLIGSQYQAAADEWKLTPPDNLELIPGANLPDLFRTGRGPLAAIWYDRLVTENGESDSDRIFLGIQDPETKGRGEVIGPADGSSNDSVAATSVQDMLVTTWISETYETGAQVVLGVGNSPEDIDTAVVSDNDLARNSNPKVAATGDEAAVTWQQESGAGQTDSAILLRTVELGE